MPAVRREGGSYVASFSESSRRAGVELGGTGCDEPLIRKLFLGYSRKE
jgi:hypothetical protein